MFLSYVNVISVIAFLSLLIWIIMALVVQSLWDVMLSTLLSCSAQGNVSYGACDGLGQRCSCSRMQPIHRWACLPACKVWGSCYPPSSGGGVYSELTPTVSNRIWGLHGGSSSWGLLPGEKLAVPATGFGDAQGTSVSASGHDSLAS